MKLTECKKASIYDLNRLYICDASVSFTPIDPENPETAITATLTFTEAAADYLRSEAYITFYDNVVGLITFYCTLSNYKETLIAPGLWYSSVQCTLVKEVEKQQRRNDIKISVKIDTILAFINSEDVLTEVSAIIRNISAGGIFFTCHYPFQLGQTFSFSFGDTKKSAVLSAEILRIQPPEDMPAIIGREADDSGILGYGCKFINLSPFHESLIRNFVFKQDLYHKKMLI